MKYRWTKIIAVSALVTLTLLYQNCTKTEFIHQESESHQNTSTQGNGDSYGGKASVFAFSDPAASCSELGADGKPLPRNVIFVLSQSEVQLTREDCMDLEKPQAIPFSGLSFDSAGQLSYLGKTYVTFQQNSDFSLVAADCPSGYVQKTAASRINLVQSSQNLTDYSVWWNHLGIATDLDGSFGGLMRYTITRDDPKNLDFWRRIHQSDFPLEVNETYAYSFLAKPKTFNDVMFSLHVSGGVKTALSLIFEMDNNGNMIQQERNNIPFYSATSRSFAGGRFYTVYFTMPNNTGSSVIGITPNGIDPVSGNETAAVGDSIHATAIQLEKISNFCSQL